MVTPNHEKAGTLVRLLRAELLRSCSRRATWTAPIGIFTVAAAAVLLGSLQGKTWPATSELPDVLADTAGYLAWTFAAVGASLLGAEHANGDLTRLLSVEPRRRAVVGTKLAVVFITTGAGAVLALIAVTVMIALAVLIGPFAGEMRDLLGADLLRQAGAAAVGAGFAGAFGGVAGLVCRSTGAALIAVTLTLVVIEPTVGALVPELTGLGPGFSLVAAMGGPHAAAAAVVGDDGTWPTTAAWAIALGGFAAFTVNRRDIVDVG